MDKRLILNEIKLHYKFKTDSEFARFLGVNSQNIRNWYNRNNYNANLLIDKCQDISPQFIITGEGEMLRENEQISKASVNSDEWKEKAVLWMKIASERLEMIEMQREVIQMLKDEIKKLKSTQQDEQSRTA